MLCLRGRYSYDLKNKKRIKSLQAQVRKTILQKKDRASCPASRRGSATIEASLILPCLLIAICSLAGVGQLLILETDIHFAAASALRRCSGMYACVRYGGDTEAPEQVFKKVLEQETCGSGLIPGGISVRTETDSSSQEILLSVSYTLRIPYPMVDRFRFRREICMRQRIFSGFVPHGGWQEPMDRIVYVADSGTVYHTHMDCSYICLRITDGKVIEGIIHSSRIRPCKKCAGRAGRPSSIIVTPGGEHYHVTASCSALKRSFRAVRYRDVAGMRKCSRCVRRDR